MIGSSGRTRTYNPSVNSRLLYHRVLIEQSKKPPGEVPALTTNLTTNRKNSDRSPCSSWTIRIANALIIHVMSLGGRSTRYFGTRRSVVRIHSPRPLQLI